MRVSKIRFVLASVGCAVLFFSLLANSLPVLDEGGYVWIGTQMTWSRPYDWQLPWPPFGEENAYVYAHPPLFLWMVKATTQVLSLEQSQWLLGLCWQVLFSGSVAWLIHEKVQNPWQGILLWFGLAGVALPCTRSLMPDLQAGALATTAMVLWMFADGRRSVLLLCGLVLGLSCWTKYPALLLLFVPVIHAKKIEEVWWVVGGVLLIVGIGELWLYALYDSIHLIEVIKRAPEIARSSLLSRFIGICNRLPLSAFGIVLLLLLQNGKGKYVWLGTSFAASMGIAYHLNVSNILLAGVLGSAGMQVFRLFMGGTVLHTWAWLVFVGVVMTHNYASPRYWLLAMAPLVVLVLQKPAPHALRWIAIVGSLLISVLLARAEKIHSEQGQQLAIQAREAYPEGYFSGEWTFYWQMQQMGASNVQDTLPEIVIVAQESAGGLAQPEKYRLLETFRGSQHALHLVSAPDSVGYYADTLGYWPILWRDSSMEQVQVWKRK